MAVRPVDPLELAGGLIRCPSVTPKDAGALDLLQGVLEGLGFTCHRLAFEEDGTDPVDNLYARIGTAAPNVCFAGHTDVVPPGNAADWRLDPFAGTVEGDQLYGRGASDMKAAVACFVAAASRVLAARGLGGLGGSISLLITGDEEGPAVNGTRKVLDWLQARGERLDACLVGEPTCPKTLGEMMKIGRRGSLNGYLTVTGVQGHSAYPERADNPIPRLLAMLNALTERPLDEGSDHFQATSLVITTVDVGNPATNVIPAKAFARFNIRFNDLHSSQSLDRRLREILDRVGGAYDLRIEVSGESFLTPPGPLSDAIAEATRAVTGLDPELSTTGGTSDARFIKDFCPVTEFGMVGATAHKVDESIPAADVERLTAIYAKVIERMLASGAPA